jgi:hypothetical protein
MGVRPDAPTIETIVTPVETGVQDIYKSWKNWIPAPASDPIRLSPE